jgi:hypothetical protein
VNMPLSPRARIRSALLGQEGDQVPLSIYWFMLPRGDVERRLRNQGLAIVERVPLFHVEMPNVQVLTREYYENGVRTVRETVRTPVGEVHAVKSLDPSYGTSWWNAEWYIKERDDYRVLEFMVRDMVYRPEFEAFRLAERRAGEDGFVIGNTEYSPMNKLIYDWMGIEQFSLDLALNPDALLSLYDLFREKQREMFRLCAESPAELVIYCGNIHADVVGRERFEQYYIPCLNEMADTLHEAKKLCACHLDAKMKSLVKAVGQSRIDVVEAFTPVPTCDVTVREARAAWPDKVLWINFPSSLHIATAERIRAETVEILRQAAPGDRFLIGVTEDIPEGAWRTSLSAISQTVQEYGQLPIQI